MKKLLLVVIVFLTGIINANAEGSQQYFASYTYGVQKLNIQNCLQSISNTGIPPATINVYVIVASDFDVSNVSNITLTAYTGFTISVDLPTDRSAALTPTGLNFQTKKTADGSTYNYTLFIHKINKATIPYSLNFGSLFPYNTATPDFNGWGYRLLNNASTPQLASPSSTNSFFLAFNPSLSKDSLVCNYYASNNNTQTGLAATISASGDGVSWATLKTTNNDLPANSATTDQKRLALLLPVGTQYIQYLMTTKGSSDPAVNINVIYLKHQTTYTTTVIESKKTIHPRLYLDQAGINQLKTQITTGKYLTLYNRLITAVNRYPSAPTTAVATGTDLRAWGDRLLNLSIAYKLSGNSTYLTKAESYASYLMTAPDSYYSDPDLEPGHHLSGLSVFYDWCFNEMNSTVKSNMIAFINTKGNLLNTWLNSSAADTQYYLSNQLTSRMSGLGSAALAFYECFDTKGWISTVMEKFILAESVRGDDGGFAEAASYGGYDLDFQMRFFDLAKVLLSDDFYNSIWWSNCANYQVYMTLPYNSWSSKLNVVDIGDSPRYLWYGPDYMLRGIAKEKRDGYAQQLADMVETKVINNDVALALNLLRYDGTVSSTTLTNLPLLHHFDNYGVVTTRDSWSNNKSLVSFTCGPALGLQFVQNNTFDAGTGHSHPNANSFSIFSNGEFLIRNPGYVLRRTDQENTLLVDTYGQLDQPITQNYWVSTAQASAKLYPTMIKVESNPDFDIMVGDATKSYSAVNKYERTLIYMKPNVVLVLDNIQSAANHNFELFFHAEQMMDSVVNINNTYKVKGDFTDMVINPLTTIGVTIDAKNKSVLTRDQTSIAYTNFVVDLKKTTNTWMNAIAFSWNDKNLTPTDVSIVSKNGNVWIFNIGGKLLTYDWINRNATLNTTATLNTVATNLQGISNPIPFVRVLSSGQKQIDLLIDNKIEPGATACLYSSNGICMKRTNIAYEKTQIQLDDCYRGLYLLNVINGIQSKTYKIIL